MTNATPPTAGADAGADAAPPSAPASLTPKQRQALFDILTHRETYAEIESFKYPDAVTSYGYPFSSETIIPAPSKSGASTPLAVSGAATPRSRTPVPVDDLSRGVEKVSLGAEGEDGEEEEKMKEETKKKQVSSSPVLQTLFTRFVLTLPWMRDLPGDFWAVRVQGILSRFAEAELSESYDKGALGLRKTLATGSSALIEMLGRGALGKVKRRDGEDKSGGNAKAGPENGDAPYDFGRGEDLERAWDDAIQGLVYGDLVEKACDYVVETDDLEAFSPTIKGAAHYSIYHLATFLHHIFVISPEGQYLLQLLQNIHGLVPYKMVKQTLRIGNAATMINGMVRLMLAKLSIGGITNWFGLTTNADDGMNLLQRIISLVLSWDSAEFKKAADKVEKERAAGDESGRPSEEILAAIRQFVNEKERMEHEAVRAGSVETSQSIISALLASSDGNLEADGLLSETGHAQCLEYYSALLSIRDRDVITGVLCRQQPDLFTQLTREMVNAYEPFIRMVHAGIDLREYVERMQGFIDDFIKASKPKKVGKETRPASVEDYVELLMKNRGLMYSWIHAVASQCPEVWTELVAWCKATFTKFGVDDTDSKDEKSEGDATSSPMDTSLDGLFQSLPDTSRPAVLEALDAHADFLSKVGALSRNRLQQILDSTRKTRASGDSVDANESEGHQVGPGIYLLRWHGLLDETPITPEKPKGDIRKGRDVKNTLAQGKTTIVGSDNKTSTASQGLLENQEDPQAPDVKIVVKMLGEGFVKILQEIGGPDK